jgi:hypothetical protein
MEQVPFDYRSYVNSFENDLENYINNQRFLDKDWEGDPIPVDIQIVLSGGANNKFYAQMYVLSKRQLDGAKGKEGGISMAVKLLEKSWAFEYNQGANLTYNPSRFDKFTSVLDYYMLLVIGSDMDTYESNGGNVAFEKARNIAVNGAGAGATGFESNARANEFNKYNLINEINDPKYTEVRRLIFMYYVNGLDKMLSNLSGAKTELKNILIDMSNYKRNKIVNSSLLLQIFFDAKGAEIAGIFNGEKDDAFWGEMMFLDPGNTIIYTQAREGKYEQKNQQ